MFVISELLDIYFRSFLTCIKFHPKVITEEGRREFYIIGVLYYFNINSSKIYENALCA